MGNRLSKIVVVFLITVAALLANGCGGAPTTSTGPINPSDIPGPPSPQELEAGDFLFPELPRITAQRLKYMLDAGEPVVVVDTRLPMFYNGGHIPESINIPIVSDEDLENPEDLYTLPKDKTIVFYCD